ncbi:hypothetical protein Ddye_003405 [Dipteronia dyeriana]|uniref:Uncharacterized protein n=1 Tax=Dipteronia dyeriana TaxID=168575 RepID=A0AAD9XS53_9ROSI|nr:hypothetical protein Ddye_003405 [Dipteronia dyeriana]
MLSSSIISLHLRLFVLLVFSANAVFSATTVKTLPGFDGELPFTLETGYTSVGEIEFFYYFVESENNPAADPLFLYLNGGPGCSGLNGFFYQIGPLKFSVANYTGGLPTLLYEPSAWSKTANIIFLDFPIGAGFSYANTTDAWNTTDIKASAQAHTFLRNWLRDHPDFQTNPVYIGSDSYAGINVPIIALDVIEGNTAGLEPNVNLKGLSLGCPHTDTIVETNAKIPFAHNLALISDEMYESAKQSCNGTYADVNATNTECVESLDAITECIELISPQNILDANCALLSPEAKEVKNRRYLSGNAGNFLLQPHRVGDLYCHNFPYVLSGVWANYKIVQEALGIRQGTIREFHRCNISLAYTVDMNTVVPQHKNLTNTGLQVIVYSGDHDMVMPHNGIEEWISSLDLTVDIAWRPWFIKGQVAGYTTKYTNSGYRLTYATIKGAGHSPQEYKRTECYTMFNRWIHYYPL